MSSSGVQVRPSRWVLPDRVGFLEWIQSTFKYDDISLQKQAGVYYLAKALRSFPVSREHYKDAADSRRNARRFNCSSIVTLVIFFSAVGFVCTSANVR